MNNIQVINSPSMTDGVVTPADVEFDADLPVEKTSKQIYNEKQKLDRYNKKVTQINAANRLKDKQFKEKLEYDQWQLRQKLIDQDGGILEESTANQFLITEHDIKSINILNKGFWSREREIDFQRMYRRLSLFGIFGLDTDINIKEPEVSAIGPVSNEGNRLQLNKQKRFEILKEAVGESIAKKFRVDKMDNVFKFELNNRAPDLFLKVLKQFEIESKEELEFDINADPAQSMCTIQTKNQLKNEVQKKTKQQKEKLKELNMFEYTYTQEFNISKDELMRENLSHEQIAMAKLLMQVGDKEASYEQNLERFKNILLSPKINKQELREICFQDDINKELSHIEKNFDERRERKIAQKKAQKARFKRLKKHYSDKVDGKQQFKGEYDEFGNKILAKQSTQSEDQKSSCGDYEDSSSYDSEESSFDSEASRINFWRDINTSDNEYTNAVIVSRQGGLGDNENIFTKLAEKQKEQSQMLSPAKLAQVPHVQFDFGGQDMLKSVTKKSTKSGTTRDPGAKAHQQHVKQMQKEIIRLREKVDKMKSSHEQEKKGIKASALNYAIDYFKSKSKELIKLFTNEGMKMLQQYTFLRDQLLGRDSLLKKAVQYSEQQEDIIMELRAYIEQFNLDIVEAMQKRNAGAGRPKYQKSFHKGGKPVLDRMLSVDSEHMFELYKSVILIDNSAEKGVVVSLKNEINELQSIIDQQKAEIQIQSETQEIWRKDTYLYENKIKLLEEDNRELIKQIDQLRAEKDEHIKKLEVLVETNFEQFKKDKKRLQQINEIESKVQQKIMNKYSEEYEKSKAYLRHIKNVLRIPRLYNEFARIQKQITDDKQLEVYLKSSFIKASHEINEEGIDSINAALRLQFHKELELSNLRDDVLRNINVSTYNVEYGDPNSKLYDFKFNDWVNSSINGSKIESKNYLKKINQAIERVNAQKHQVFMQKKHQGHLRQFNSTTTKDQQSSRYRISSDYFLQNPQYKDRKMNNTSIISDGLGDGSFNTIGKPSNYLDLNDFGPFQSVIKSVGMSNIIHEDQNSIGNASPITNKIGIHIPIPNMNDKVGIVMTSRPQQTNRRLKTQGRPRYIPELPIKKHIDENKKQETEAGENTFSIRGYPCLVSVSPPLSIIGTPQNDSHELLMPERQMIKSQYRIGPLNYSVDLPKNNKGSIKSTKGSSYKPMKIEEKLYNKE